jgi:hypothetical protein
MAAGTHPCRSRERGLTEVRRDRDSADANTGVLVSELASIAVKEKVIAVLPHTSLFAEVAADDLKACAVAFVEMQFA